MYIPKYESRSKRFPQTHVVVFSNWWPDRSQLSADRWDVKELRNIDVERFELGWSGKRVRGGGGGEGGPWGLSDRHRALRPADHRGEQNHCL